MQTNKINSESLDYFLSLSGNMISETKDFLFQLMTETARIEDLTNEGKEDRIYFIYQLHQLLTGLETERKS